MARPINAISSKVDRVPVGLVFLADLYIKEGRARSRFEAYQIIVDELLRIRIRKPVIVY